MADETLIIALVAVTIAVTGFLLARRPDTVRRYFFEPIENGRMIVGLLVLVLASWTFLRSGVAWLMLVALLGIAFAVTFVYFEEPHKEIR